MRDFLTIIGAFLLLLALFMLVFYALLPVICKLGPFVSKICAIAMKVEHLTHFTQITDGNIYKKEIISEEFHYWNYIPMRYRIHIKKDVNVYSTYFYYYDVTEVTYSMYSIGDWFDIQKIKTKRDELYGRKD